MWRILKGDPPSNLTYLDYASLPEVGEVEALYEEDVEKVAARRGRETPEQYQEALVDSTGRMYVGVHLMYQDGYEESLWYRWDDGTAPLPGASTSGGVAGKFIVAGLGIVALGLGAIWLSKK